MAAITDRPGCWRGLGAFFAILLGVGPNAAPAQAGGQNPLMKLPLQFEVNQGQVNPQVKFLARGPGYSLFLTSTEAVLTLRSDAAGKSAGERGDLNSSFPAQRLWSGRHAVLRMKLVGGDQDAEVIGLQELAGKTNYFIGDEPAKWHTDVPNYARVQYRDVYPGIDLVYYGNQGQLEYDFVVAPGADPGVIRLSFEGAEKVRVDRSGDLMVDTTGGAVRWKKPVIYQETTDGRRAVPGRYALIGAPGQGSGNGRGRGVQQVGFRVAAYDREKPLVIDPTLVYSTLVGGGFAGGRSGWDMAFGLAVDASGSAYITGRTGSNDFPTLNPFQAPPGTLSPAFVTKLNPEGTAILYSTYLGEVSENLGGSTVGLGIAVDTSGHAYITGVITGGGAFPTTPGAFQAVSPDPLGRSSFVTKLSPAGNALVYSTYLSGGPGSWEEANDIAVDTSGNAYVTGWTTADSFPAVNPLQPSTASPSFPEAFVTKINPAGSALVYSTPLGGSDHEQGLGVAVDALGRAYVTGSTNSIDFPTVNPYQSTYGGLPADPFGQFFPGDAFVARLNAAGSALEYSTYLGGPNSEIGLDVAADASGSAYVTGWSAFGGFPTTAGAFQTSALGARDPFVTKLAPGGSSLAYSTYLGGVGTDEGHGIAVDLQGNAYVTGLTDSTDFPVLNAFQPALASSLSDAFITELNPVGSALVYSSYLGGTDRENPPNSGLRLGLAHVAVDSVGRAYVAGWTSSVDFPTTASAFQVANNGAFDGFVAKVASVAPQVALSLEAIVPNRGGNAGVVTATMHGTGLVEEIEFKLVRQGEPDIVPVHTKLDPNGNFATALFDLRERVPGLWSLEADGSDGSAALVDAFTIEAGGGPVVFTDVIGPVLTLRDRATPFTFLVGNSGNTDALGVLVFIGGLPKDATIQLHFDVTQPSDPNMDPGSVSPFMDDDTDPTAQILPLFIPVLGAGNIIPLALTVTVPTARCIILTAVRAGPLVQFPPPENEADLCNGWVANAFSCFSSLPFPPPLGCALGILEGFRSISCAAISDNPLELNFLSAVRSAAGAGLSCVEDLTFILKILNTIRRGFSITEKCSKFITGQALDVCIASAFDPNDKVGATGTGPQRYMSGEEPVRYMILFENKPEATAPAHEVVITDALQAAQLDLDTVSLGPIVFGGRHVTPPSGRTEFATDVDLRPDRNVIVRIEAGLDKDTGVITWSFVSLDPATEQPSVDPLGGFLPPNQFPPEGDGSVFFTVAVKTDAVTGTEIRNSARIVFDTNEPIDTPEWLNTIDRSKPASQVLAPEVTGCESVNLSWSGTDQGSGIRSYTIFISEAGGPYIEWLANTTATSGDFTGQPGSTYAFYSVARDHAGNLETAPPVADVTLVAGTDGTPPSITAPPDINVGNDPGLCSAILTPGTATATDNCSAVTIAGVRGDGLPLTAPYPAGTTTINWTATDGGGNSASANQAVVVTDVEAPLIVGAAVDKPTLWPPDHKMKLVTVNYALTDNCDSLATIACSLSVTSNEPINGTGDGDTAPDWEILDTHHVRLRSERAGTAPGRIYTITITCTDSRGNLSSQSVVVRVPVTGGT